MCDRADRWSARVLRAGASVAVVLVLGACASRSALPSFPARETLPPGSPLASRTLAPEDAWLRHYLASGEPDAALHLLGKSYPSDRLLRHLQAGVVLHQAGRYAESNDAFEWAEREIDRRHTKSIRRGAGSLLLNDRVLAYLPSPAEGGVVPYYRMLNYLALGEVESAAVEARKASAALDRLEERERCAENGLVRYLTGLVFDAAGETNDALVSLRRAERSFDSCAAGAVPVRLGSELVRAATALGLPELADSTALRYALPPQSETGGGTGELVVLVEQGFAAHRAEEELYLPIARTEIDGLEEDDHDGIALVAERIGAQLRGGEWAGGRSGLARHDDLDDLFLLRLAWPVVRREANRPAAVRVVVDSVAVDAAPVEDISARVERALDAQRLAIGSRLVARALTRSLLSFQAEEKAEEKGGELAGFLVGLLTNTASNALERADTRSWTLLPDRIALAQLALPAGTHHVRLELLSASGAVVGTEDVGTVTLRPGGRAFLSRRVWGRESGATSSLAGEPRGFILPD